MKKTIFILIIALLAGGAAGAQSKRLMFDLSHGQFKDNFPKEDVPGQFNSHFYDYVIPDYQKILAAHDIEYVPNTEEITSKSLKDIDVLLMLSPLHRSTQIPITEGEKEAIVKYIKKGGSVIMLVDEESYRVILDEYGANDITQPFGITIGEDIEDVPGNCGAISIENEIFSGRWGVPYSGSRKIYGGIPGSVCMEGGYVHGAYIKTKKGGKLYVMGETMVGLLMGNPNGERNTHNGMKTNWWGADSRKFMEELIVWAAGE